MSSSPPPPFFGEGKGQGRGDRGWDPLSRHDHGRMMTLITDAVSFAGLYQLISKAIDHLNYAGFFGVGIQKQVPGILC